MVEQATNNWGRFGEDDQLGMLNLQTPATILEALQSVKHGKVYNLQVPLEAEGPQHPMFHKTWLVTFMTTDPNPAAFQVADDVVTFVTHSGTHIDALGHCWKDGKMWNGRDADNVTSYGIKWASIDKMPGLIGRGVMLDIPKLRGVEHLRAGDVVTGEEMEACARSQNVEIRAGDVLLVRTGWYNVFQKDLAQWNEGEPGPDASCTAWLKEKNVVAIGADNAGVEAYVAKSRSPLSPRLHITALRDLGVYLIEHVNLEELARDQVYEFLFIGAPLRLTKATGSPLA
ncbi:MAG: cyclase family protein, partial [Chloroflexi bacterium]|nr:cyclase family protein [Chloroflexota bacterium]